MNDRCPVVRMFFLRLGYRKYGALEPIPDGRPERVSQKQIHAEHIPQVSPPQTLIQTILGLR